MMRNLVRVLAATSIAGCLMIGGLGVAQIDPTPPAKAPNDQATDGVKSSAAPPAAPASNDPPAAVEAGPIAETTTVRGKIDTDLKGVWLLVARIELAPGKFKSFPQIIKINQGKDGPQFNLLDVKLPEEIDKSVFDANNMTLSRWAPSDEMREKLAKSWAKLPHHKLKTMDDFLYNKIEYTLVAPDGYADILGPGANTSPGLTNVLKESRFMLKVLEKYKPRQLPANSRVTQLMSRTTIYGVKTVEKGVLKGENSLGFYAAGAGTPLPMTFVGPFEMYRLADLS